MDETIRHHNPNPLVNANPLSKLFFWWLNDLFKTGYKRNLEVEDMFNVLPEDTSELLGNKLQSEWDKELLKSKSGGKPSLLKAMIRTHGKKFMLLGLIAFFEEGVKVVQPVLLGVMIRYFVPDSTVSRTEAYMFASGISICAISLAITHHPYFFGVAHIGMQIRVACCSLLYKKALKLSNKALGQTTTGQIVNLMSNDVNRFDQAVLFIHFLWIGPVQALVVLYLLWRQLGPATLSGFAVLVLLMPLQTWMGKLFSRFRRKTAVHTDERIKFMNEIISGMRVIKMYCWEKPFGQLIEKVRRKEIEKIRSANVARSLILAPFFVSSKLIIFLMFLTIVLTKNSLLAEQVFVAMALLTPVRLVMNLFVPFAIQLSSETKVTIERLELILLLMFVTVVLMGNTLVAEHVFVAIAFLTPIRGVMNLFVPLAIERSSEALVTIDRLEEFLLLDERVKKAPVEKSESPDSSENGVILTELSAKWQKNQKNKTIQKVSVSVKPGELLAVIGPVGAGKSSLLMAILDEMEITEGSISVTGKLAYAAQQPWVFSASVRQNIVFGNKYDPDKYQKVIKAAALTRDLSIMPDGDGTLIGDRGVSLSGGQRARISLARGLYMDADIYLLDDPLSAVDTAVGRHIFDQCINGYLRAKPRILVTHQLQFLESADKILILKEGEMIGLGTFDELSKSGIETALTSTGEMIGLGTFDELSKSGIDFSSLLKRPDEEKHEVLSSPQISCSGFEFDNIMTMHDIGSVLSLASIGAEFVPESVVAREEETRKQGTVGLKIYIKYFKTGSGILLLLLLIVLNIITQTSYIMADWWLAIWANKEEDRFVSQQEYDHLVSLGYNATNITIPYIDVQMNITILSAITASVFVFGLLRAFLFFAIAVNAAEKLHNEMFARLLRTSVSFFDTNPVGRILNRFTKDVGQMDDMLPVTFFDFVQCALLILGIVVVAGVVNPYVFIPTVPLCIAFLIVRHYYLATSRDIKRLESASRSPVFSHLSATLLGLSTIRAFNVEKKFQQEFDSHQDLHSEGWYLVIATTRWFAIRLDCICALFVTAVSLGSVFASESLDAGLVGLSMAYAMNLTGLFQWGVRQSAEVESQMISVERVVQYGNLPEEAAMESDKDHRPPPDWPQRGIIRMENAALRYSPTAPLILRNLNFTIHEKEKIGIVGRTGAGKSSLITMLFRLTEPSGQIYIDDVCITEIGLHELRDKISIIPQDPVLFCGSLRRNLDPFQQHEDAMLWKALEEVELKAAVEDIPGRLEAEVAEGGINLSVGQRQLVCLARALLRRNKILVIDEATANVDPRTDALIQLTIREKFQHCTVLTIAHRLHTIMDSDRVMVLDEGEIMQFAEPYTLLQSDGYFYDMVQQTGKSEADNLTEIAKSVYDRKKLSRICNGEVSGDRPETLKHDNARSNTNISDGSLRRRNVSVSNNEEDLESEQDALLPSGTITI